MQGGKDYWLTSAFTLAVTGGSMMLGAPYVAIGAGIGSGICMIAAKIEDVRFAKKTEMLRACGLYIAFKNGDYVYPNIISLGENYMTLDPGKYMDFKDIKARTELIERYYGKKVIIKETSNRKVVIRVLDVSKNEEDRWLVIFNQLGIVDLVGSLPSLSDSEVNHIGQKVSFDLPANMTIDSFIKKKSEFEYLLKRRVDISVDNYKLVIQMIDREIKNFYTIDFRKNMLDDMSFLIGVGAGESPVTLDLGGNEFSTLVCGSSGSGKSAFLNCLLVQMILRDVIIHAIDMKAVEFSCFKRYHNMKMYANNRKDAVKVLGDTYDLMQERYQELEDTNCKSYADYNKKFDNSMKSVLLIIDEFSALTADKKANMFLFELTSRARAANIVVVVCTQLPKAKILDTSIRGNIKNTVCFSLETDTDSEVGLGQKGNFRAARELKTVGRGLLKYKKQLTEFQGYFLEQEQIDEQIKHKMTSQKSIPKKESNSDGEKVIPIPKKKDKKVNVEDIVAKIDSL